MKNCFDTIYLSCDSSEKMISSDLDGRIFGSPRGADENSALPYLGALQQARLRAEFELTLDALACANRQALRISRRFADPKLDA
jgi:hypothetical protein